MDIKRNVPLANHTSFKIGGDAKYFIFVTNEEELVKAVKWAKENDTEYFILSGGSNVLFSDYGFDGLVIKMDMANRISFEENVTVSAGVSLKRFLELLAINSLSGFENLYGIPGSIGGAIRGNAGAFGVEIKDNLVKVRVFDSVKEEFAELDKEDMNFKYRYSLIKDNPHLIITHAVFEFDRGNEFDIRKQMFDILKEREKRQLQNVKAAGSFFKNPHAPKEVQKLFEEDKGVESKGGRVPAGWLIDKLGFKGKKVGGAMVSETSANYILNVNNATCEDVLNLAGDIKKKVEREFDILLEEEVSIV